ncbi:MAG: hypothetical protein ICV63_03150 [Coleofasciculus sp. Co-bin14]|nr:hypothetical protein [Coleofasciculus sp. Co-bin14]
MPPRPPAGTPEKLIEHQHSVEKLIELIEPPGAPQSPKAQKKINAG